MSLRKDKYLGNGTITLHWDACGGEDDYLQLCDDVLRSDKFSNAATLVLRCEQLPLDSRFVDCIAEHRPSLRDLHITCWTYYDAPETRHETLEGTRLQKVYLDMSDASAFPEAYNQFVRKLPRRLEYLRLKNRGCGSPRVAAANLPKCLLSTSDVEVVNKKRFLWF